MNKKDRYIRMVKIKLGEKTEILFKEFFIEAIINGRTFPQKELHEWNCAFLSNDLEIPFPGGRFLEIEDFMAVMKRCKNDKFDQKEFVQIIDEETDGIIHKLAIYLFNKYWSQL